MPASSVTETLPASALGSPARPAWLSRLGLKPSTGILLLWLVLIVLVPNLLLIGTSFLKTKSGFLAFEPSFDNYLRLWKSTGFWVLLERTLRLSFLSCVAGALVAYPLAFYVARVVRRNKALLVLLIVLPLWISLLMRVFAWRLILGQSGVLNNFLMSSGILDKPSEAFLYTSSSVILVFAYISIPFIFISTLSAFEKIPQSLLEASKDSGASAFQTFRFVVWPLTRRSLAIGFSLAFLVTVGDYVTPAMVGGVDGTTIGVLIASQFGMANNWPYGAAVAIILILSVGIVLAVVLVLCPSRGILLGDEGVRVMAPPQTPGARFGALASGIGFTAAILFLYAPLALIFLFSLNDSALQTFPMQGFSTRWYSELVQNDGLLTAARRSLVVAFFVVTFSTLVGTGFALALHYSRLSCSRFVEVALALPLATPGVVLGVVMVLGTEWLSIPSGLVRTVIGQSSFVMPVTLMLVLARLRRLDSTLVEASLDAGATRLQTFAYVLLPLIRGSITGGALLGLTLSADDVMVTLFLAGPSQTLPIWVFNQMRFGFTPTVNAVFVVLAVVCLLLVLLADRTAKTSSSSAT
jgi:spermidine/putrescine transport system permease protein